MSEVTAFVIGYVYKNREQRIVKGKLFTKGQHEPEIVNRRRSELLVIFKGRPL